jgi:hypothetical protein
MLLSSPLLLMAVVYAALVAVGEIGFRVGRRSRASTDQPARELGESVQTASLGLLALLLGFSFGLVASRYDSRRQVVLREANAIATAYLQARLLPAAQRSESQAIFRDYVKDRREAYDLGTEEAARAASRSKEAQDALWKGAIGAARDAQMPPEFTIAVLKSLNEVMDASEAAVDAFEDKIPPSIMRLLIAVAAIASAIAGFCNGVSERRLLLILAIQPLLVALVIASIADMDQPFRGRTLASRNALLRAEASMH